MDQHSRASEQQRTLTLAFKRAGLTVEELWVRYFGLGGDAGPIDIDAYVHGLAGLDPFQRDILAHAVNERLDEITPAHRAAYSRPFRESRPNSQPLAALVRLLEGTHLAPPERLRAVAEAAGEALGVRITVYLADYDQRRLHPLPRPAGSFGAVERGDHDQSGHHRTTRDRAERERSDRERSERERDDPERKPLEVDTTLAGRAFRHVQTLPAVPPGRPRLWVPLLDGAERLGVLEVEVTDTEDLYDPGLRTQCRWLSTLLGHMVTLLTQHGDALDRVRLNTPRTVDGELIWSLLPPLTAGVDRFVVTGVVE
ncbi:hypothetical protein AB0G02_38185, partial [Actinosynnema sp. NPDC023658]